MYIFCFQSHERVSNVCFQSTYYRFSTIFVGVGCMIQVIFSVFSSCISSKNNFFEDQNHRAPVISFLKIEAPIQKIPCRPRFFFLPVTLLFIRNRNNHSMHYYRLKKKSPDLILCLFNQENSIVQPRINDWMYFYSFLN